MLLGKDTPTKIAFMFAKSRKWEKNTLIRVMRRQGQLPAISLNKSAVGFRERYTTKHHFWWSP
jgi:hypothetical protein